VALQSPLLLVVAIACGVAAVIWGRSTLRLAHSVRRLGLDAHREARVATDLARSAFRKELHATLVYVVAGLAALAGAISDSGWATAPRLLIAVPVVMTLAYGGRFIAETRLIEERTTVVRRAEEVLSQQELAPRQWAERLAPQALPEFQGFEVGQVYEAGTGLMAGDFYDVHLLGPKRLAAVIGDVSGHGIEASITAFQVKYLLRVFLRQYRDPAQALEELNVQIAAQTRPDEFVSLCVAVFDENVGTVRYASAGHPPAWLLHDGEVRPLSATGSMLTLDPRGGYGSREMDLVPGDTLLLYTDGLAEARSGGQLFGEERIAQALRRDPRVSADVLCKSLLTAAREFSTGPLRDDVAILAIRKV